MNENNGMPIEDYFAAQEAARAAAGPDLSLENVARAVQFMEAWSEFGKRGMGLAAAGDLDVLIAFAKQQLDDYQSQPWLEDVERNSAQGL